MHQVKNNSNPFTNEPARHTKLVSNWLARGLGVGHVAAGLGAEIVDVVERMHGSISQAPLPLSQLDNDRAGGLTGLIYRSIRKSFNLTELAFIFASRALEDEVRPDETLWLQTLAAMNGAFGDRLLERNSTLAINMQLINQMPSPQAPRCQVILLHGLCMSEVGWSATACQQFTNWAEQQLNAKVSFLRYNSGKRISDNGSDLSQLLESDTDLPLILIGHSMGGLLIRSTLNAAKRQQHKWPTRLTHAAMLGSPHQGAPLERISNQVTRLLNHSPYIKPFSRLSNIRSLGIKDLRFGNLNKADWDKLDDTSHTDDRRQPCPLPKSNTRFLLVAASRSETLDPLTPELSKDDLLVPVTSALGLSPNSAYELQAKHLKRQAFSQMNHLQLLSDPRVYNSLVDWLR